MRIAAFWFPKQAINEIDAIDVIAMVEDVSNEYAKPNKLDEPDIDICGSEVISGQLLSELPRTKIFTRTDNFKCNNCIISNNSTVSQCCVL